MNRVVSIVVLAVLFAGLYRIAESPHHSFACAVFRTGCPAVHVQGTVAPGWELLREAMISNLENGMETGSSLVVYHKGKKVVDVTASRRKDQTSSTLLPVFSSAKSAVAVAFAKLVDQGLLEYTAPVSTYWPEFAQNGKGHLTVGDVLKHQAVPVVAIGSNPDLQAQGKAIEDASPSPLPESNIPPRMYHATGRAQILQQILMRVDPQKRTLAQYIHDEVSQPLNIDLCSGSELGCDSDTFLSMEPTPTWRAFLSTFHCLLKLLLPASVSRAYGWTPVPMPDMTKLESTVKSFTGLTVEDLAELHKFPEVYNQDMFSFNGRSSARSLARLGRVMANNCVDPDTNKPLLSAAACENLHAVDADSTQVDQINKSNSSFTRGGLGFDLGSVTGCDYFPKDFTGWGGFGGSLFVWDRKQDFSMALVGVGMVNLLYYEHTFAVVRAVNAALANAHAEQRD